MDHIPFYRLTPGAINSNRSETAEQGEAVLPYTIGSAPQVTVPVCSALNSCEKVKY